MSVVKTKVCEGCFKVMKKPMHQSNSCWEKQKTCSYDCSAMRRRRIMGEWRASASKVCPACDTVFHPHATLRRRAWDDITYCDSYCKTYGAKGMKVAVLPAEQQDTPGKRIHWLRVSTSVCGKKTHLPMDRAADAAGISYTTWRRIEAGKAVKEKDWQMLCAKALGLPDEKLLTVSVKRWVAVVKEAGLSAKAVVVQVDGRAAA